MQGTTKCGDSASSGLTMVNGIQEKHTIFQTKIQWKPDSECLGSTDRIPKRAVGK